MVMMKFAFSSECNPKTFVGLFVIFHSQLSHAKDINVFSKIYPPTPPPHPINFILFFKVCLLMDVHDKNLPSGRNEV